MDKRLNSVSVLKNKDKVPYISFDLLENIPGILHGFSTKEGGVSTGCYTSMNLSFDRGDDRQNVLENFERIAGAIGFTTENIVLPNQWHSNNIRIVNKDNIGEGITGSVSEDDIDGQITNVPGAVLVSYGADCPSLFLVDEADRAIGMIHSGWKGTANDIGGDAVRMMREQYGTDPEKLKCVIGPSIGPCCYEVGEDVAERFMDRYKIIAGSDTRIIRLGNHEGKYMLDLWEANRQNLLDAGVKEQNIVVSGLCTKCNPELFYSHRRDGADRGTMAGFMMIKE